MHDGTGAPALQLPIADAEQGANAPELPTPPEPAPRDSAPPEDPTHEPTTNGKHDWAALRATWNDQAATPGAIPSLRAFAYAHNVSTDSIRKHQREDAANGEEWTPIQKVPPGAGGTAKVARPPAQQRVNPPPGPIVYDAEDDEPVAGEEVDGEDPTGIRALLALNALVVRRTLRRLVRGKVAPTNREGEVGMVAQLTGMTMDLAKLRRVADGEAPPPNLDPEAETRVRTFVVEHRKIEPMRVGVDDNGRAIEGDERTGEVTYEEKRAGWMQQSA